MNEDIGTLKKDYKNLMSAYKAESAAMNAVKERCIETRRKISEASKENLQLQARLRGSRTAFELMMDRYKDVERRNKAVRNIVSGCVKKPVVS